MLLIFFKNIHKQVYYMNILKNLPMIIMIKAFWLIGILSCSISIDQVNKIKSEISECIKKNEFFNSVGLNFYNYKKPINSKDIIIHFINIIEKVECETIINKGIKDYQDNKELFFKNIVVIKKNLEKMLNLLYIYDNEIIIYMKIEIKLFEIIYKKFLNIIQLDGNSNIKPILYNIDNENVMKNIVFLKKTKKYLQRSKSINFTDIHNLIKNITEIIITLKKVCININYKLSNNNDFQILFNQYVKDYNMRKIPDEYFSNETKINEKIQNYNTNTKQAIKKLKDIITEFKIPNWFDFSTDALQNLPKIHDLIHIIFKQDSFELKINDIFDVYCYHDHLLNQCYIKTFVSKKLLLCKNEIFQNQIHVFSRFSEICLMVKAQKILLGKMLQELTNSFISNIKSLKFTSQTIIFSNFTKIDELYNDIVYSLILTKYFNEKQHYVIKNTITKILKNINNYRDIYELYKKSFCEFKIQCILLLRISHIYLYMRKTNFYIEYFDLMNCINNYMQKITKIFYTCATLDFRNKTKVTFIQEILIRYSKIFKLLNNMKDNKDCIYKLDITKLIYNDLIFNQFLYNIYCDPELKLETFTVKIPYFDLSNVVFEDNVFRIKNC
ncbi:hypothetical protein NUSPORA_02345 [Nucleospora cyclopteri]